MSWHECYDLIKQYVVKIETPQGFGTGFLFALNREGTVAAIATALHVVEEANNWRQPIKLRQHGGTQEVFITHDQRAVLIDYKRDSAAITVVSGHLQLPGAFLPLMAKGKIKKVGVPVGWVGYPALAPANLCFFEGSISAFVGDDDSYFIDGVAINGVSGGPVFADRGEKGPELVGIISAYFANVQQRGTLPGLLKAHDVTHLHHAIEAIKSVDEARAAAEEAKSEQQAASTAGSEPSPPKLPASRRGRKRSA